MQVRGMGTYNPGFMSQTHLHCSNHAKKFVTSPGGREEGYSQKNWVGVCGPLPKTLTLFITKIGDIPYPIYDLTKNSEPYLQLVPWSISMLNYCERNLRRALVEFHFDNDEKVASRLRNTPISRLEYKIHTLWPKRLKKPTPFGAAHTYMYIAHIREYPPPPPRLTPNQE